MKRIVMFALAAMVAMMFSTTTAMADCSKCKAGDGGDYCYWGEGGPNGACVTHYTPDPNGYNIPSCEPLSACDGTTGGGGGGGRDPWGGPENQDPACNGWGGCSAECSSCWY